MSATKTISVWCDETSEAGESTWVVSLESGDTSETLSTHETYEAALADSKAVAAKLGLELVDQS